MEQTQIIQKLRFQLQMVRISIFFIKSYGIKSFLNKVWEIKFKTNAAHYSKWINEVEEYFLSLIDIDQTLKNFKFNPKISILIPLYNVKPQFLEKCINSVTKQSYTNWELCIYDDGSILNLKENIEIINRFKGISEISSKIRFKKGNVNKHISHALNQCLEMATGEYYIVLDDDDILISNALLFIICQLNINTNAEIIYSDEDKIDAEGNRFSPIFKPDWSNETNLNGMYITHLTALKTDTIKKVGGYRTGYEGSQDYDLILRISAVINPANIMHIPFILYHWRSHNESTAQDIYRKPYVIKATHKALSDTITRRKLNADVVKGEIANTVRLKFKIKNNPHISIIIPTYNQWKVLKRCIESIVTKTEYKNYSLIIVDNNTDRKTDKKYLADLKKEHTVIDYKHPFNFSAISNYAFAYSQRNFNSSHLVLLNNDTEVINPDWLTSMLEYSQLEDIGAVGAQLIYPDNSIQHAGVILGIQGVAGHSHKHFNISEPGHMGRIKKIQNISAVTGACLMVKSKLYEKVNGLDEINLKIAYNDVDFCLKLQQAGYRNIYTPFAKLYHYESLSRGPEDDPVKIARFNKEADFMQTKWGDILTHDPYYNINLTHEKENFELRNYSSNYIDDLFRRLKVIPLRTL
jgi:GT2 family glycosyltransferase